MQENSGNNLVKLAIIAGSLLVTVFFEVLFNKTYDVTAEPATQADVIQWQIDSPSSVCSLQDASLLTPTFGGEQLDCLSCHKQALTYHDRLGEGNLACYACHVSTDPTMRTLQLANGTGTTTDLAESSRVCGQCHQERYSAWQDGTHGIPGTVAATPCTGCHNPHKPQVALLDITKPQPPPLDSEHRIPQNELLIVGISVVALLGIALMLARRRDNV